MNKMIFPDLNFLDDYKWSEMYAEKGHVLGMWMGLENRTKIMKKAVGINFKAFLAHNQNNNFYLYADDGDWIKVSRFIFKRILNEKGWIKNVFKEIYSRAKVLLKFSQQLTKKDYTLLSNKNLLKLYGEFVEKFVDMRLYSSTPMNLEHRIPLLSNYIQELLAKFIPHQEELNNCFSILTTPDKFSYLRLCDLDLLRLSLKYKEKNFKSDLDKFTKKYTWINYTFDGVPMTAEDFENKIIELNKNKKNTKSQIQKILAEKDKLLKSKKDIIKKYKLDKQTIRFCKYASEFVYLKFFRKGIFAESYYSVEFLLEVIAKRLQTDIKTIKAMFFGEVKKGLLTGKIEKQNIVKRLKDGWILIYNGQSFDLPKNYLPVVKKNFQHDILDKNAHELKGQTAMSGSAHGQVRIVNDQEDLNKMQKGDIMVSRSTNPQLLPAMKKAAAIVTDVGGLTCHAAIVARELKIPCLVGTKIATKMLKDGDIVEVDATKGLVKKL